jgi:hypothetical protein
MIDAYILFVSEIWLNLASTITDSFLNISLLIFDRLRKSMFASNIYKIIVVISTAYIFI